MAYINTGSDKELVLSHHSSEHWRRRELELSRWIQRPKIRRRSKRTVIAGEIELDAELFTALTLFRKLGIPTEFSCAGVSMLDEPEEHSLYAYITFIAMEKTERLVQLAMNRMRHRLLVTYEPERNRYDLSSFYIGHNRSFCLLMQSCGEMLKSPEAE